MTTMRRWMLLGGPDHGRWEPAGQRVLAMPPTKGSRQTTYYYPHPMRLPGWRVTVLMYSWSGLAVPGTKLPDGTVMPGGVVNEILPWCRPCPWCYGKPHPSLETCDRPSCISRWASICTLDVLTADDFRPRGER
jgi:hypothetical protein